MSKDSKESPIVSFRVPLEVVKLLQEKGRLSEKYEKSELSNLIKEDWLRSQNVETYVSVSAELLTKTYEEIKQLKEDLTNIRRKQ